MRGSILGKGLIILLWGLLFSVISPVGLEIVLKIKTARAQKQLEEFWVREKPRYYKLRKTYLPFAIQHINPHYLFFFPFDLEERKAMNNSICSVNEEGFRGLGPEHAGGRKLAFFIGGSAAFGYLASQNSTTITGYLNEIQQEYFFVNAGVPGWNSTQELFRLVNQILAYHPTLVIAYDSVNDIRIVLKHAAEGLEYPAGTPDNFDTLYSLLKYIRKGEIRLQTKPWYERLFPRLTNSIRFRFFKRPPKSKQGGIISEELLDNAAKKYTENLRLMDILTRAYGGRFIGIFQPILWLHQHVPANIREDARAENYKQFYEFVFKKYTPTYEYLDFLNIFDAHYQNVPMFSKVGDDNITEEGTGDITDTEIFIDAAHLYDRGNKLIAQEICNYLKATQK